MRRQFRLRGAKHREEAAKLSAGLLNGVAIACLIGASFGPLLNRDLDWGLGAIGLLVAALVFHGFAHFVLSLGFKDDVL